MDEISVPDSPDTALRTIRERISKRAYVVQRPFPICPEPPAITRKPLHILSLTEINNYQAALLTYRTLMIDYNEEVYDFWDEALTLHWTFRDDIALVFGMTDHPKEIPLFEAAWTRADGRGYDAVALEYAALVELVR